MSKVTVSHDADKTIVSLPDLIDENFDIAQQATNLKKQIYVMCPAVKRINSTGVKKWVQFFQNATREGHAVFYLQVPPILIEQFNLISNFGGGGTVISAQIPFMCKSCGKPNLITKVKKDLEKVNLERVDWPCQHCAKPTLEFDDLPDEYLQFWMR